MERLASKYLWNPVVVTIGSVGKATDRHHVLQHEEVHRQLRQGTQKGKIIVPGYYAARGKSLDQREAS